MSGERDGSSRNDEAASFDACCYESKRKGVFTFCQSMRCALHGIAACLRSRNFRIELCFAVLALVLAAVLSLDVNGWALIVVCIFSVLALEIANTALESLVDLASPDFHELAGKAKDCAAGAVLVASLGSVAVGAVLFLPRIAALIG